MKGNRLAASAAVLGLAAGGAAGCGSSSGSPQTLTTPSIQTTVTPPPSSTSPTAAPSSAGTASSSPSHQAPSNSPSSSGTPSCGKAEVGSGTWKPVLGSNGAGHVSADIAFQNTSPHACTISGFPVLTLYTAAGAALPTTVTDFPATASPLTVPPGAWFHAELRYSADIPGPGEPPSGACEPTAGYALVRLPGDSASVRVDLTPPSPVCEKGAVEAKPFLAGASSPPGG